MTVVIPFAEQEERDLIGCVLASRRGRRLAFEMLNKEHFYDPRCARVFEAVLSAAADAAELSAAPGYKLEARLAAVADLAGIEVEWLEGCVEDRPTFADENGSAAQRVRAASSRRAIMSWAASIHRAAGEGDEGELVRLLGEAPCAV